jgi:uncharacterized membrane protein YfcA
VLDTWFIARALGFGSLIGFSLGAFGAGGSLLTVPILVYAIGVPVQGATGSSLAIVGLNAATGALDYVRRGRALPRTALAFALSGVVAALAGVWLNHQAPGELVLVLFSVLMLGAALAMLRQRPRGAFGTAFDERYAAAGWVRLVVAGLLVGLLTGFFGIGGGFLVVPALVLVLGVPMHLAVGTSLLIIMFNAVWGLLGNLQLGTLDWSITAPFALGGVAGVLLGGRVAGRLPDRLVRNAFALLIVAVAVYTFSRSAPALLAG